MRIVIKIGSNVITRNDGKLDITRMSGLVDQVAWLRAQGHEVILVSSGAVACGRGELKVAKHLDSVEQRQLFSAMGQAKLIELYYSLFREYGIHVGQVLTMKKNFSTPRERQNQQACMDVMIENGVIPIVNENDTVCVTELMFTDNDELSGLIATMMRADLLIILSNIDGIYDGSPSDPRSKVIRRVDAGCDLSEYIQQEKSGFGRGGMATKCGIARQVAADGIRVIIANGKRDDILVDLMERPEETIHTEFYPSEECSLVRSEECGVRSSLVRSVECANNSSLLTTHSSLNDGDRNRILLAVADAVCDNKRRLLEANAKDLARMERDNPLYDRLMLTDERLEAIANDIRNVATLPSPLGKVSKERTLDNGLRLKRVSVPFGVIGVIYEARPNVTFDVFSLCFKSGNACVLKGGKDADCSNREAVAIIHEVLAANGVSPDVVTLLPATHEATAEMLNAVGRIDLCIPRGGRKLIDFVRDTARIPVIETGAGVVNAYFDASADLEMGKAIVCNAKTRRVSVCNALDCLIVNSRRLRDLPALCEPLAKKHVVLYADARAYESLNGIYPTELLEKCDGNSFGTEYMDYKMAVKTVDTIDEAIAHIDKYGSGHSECIITSDEANARLFQQRVDAACVYVNAPTSFTDGAQFGLGAEIGISTQKLGPRGPMALEEITTYKWLIEGEGQVRN